MMLLINFILKLFIKKLVFMNFTLDSDRQLLQKGILQVSFACWSLQKRVCWFETVVLSH